MPFMLFMPLTSPLPLLIGCALGIMALLFVLYPLYQEHGWGKPSHAPALDTSAGFASRSEGERAARSALVEVELDYQLGNLADPDYRSLRERYTRRAFAARKSLQAHERDQEQEEHELDELIEERLLQMRIQQAQSRDGEAYDDDETTTNDS